MIVRDDRTSLEITLRELGLAGTQSEGELGVNIAVSNGAFAGRNDTVWIGRDDWQRFLRALKELDRTRRGDARVTSMSPDELELVVFATDRACHMLLKAGSAGRGMDGIQYCVTASPSASRSTRAYFRD